MDTTISVDKPGVELDEAVRTYHWALFVTLTFPIDDPTIVKQARANFLEWLRSQEISYFYVFEFTQKPHYHMLWNKCARREVIVTAWQKSLQRAFRKSYVSKPVVDLQPITPGTVDRVYDYVLKDVSDPLQRQRALEQYDLAHVWGYGGKDFRTYYSYVQTVILRDRGVTEGEYDAHYQRLKAVELIWEEKAATQSLGSYDQLITDTKRYERLFDYFFSLGLKSFNSLFDKYLTKRAKPDSFGSHFRSYLRRLGSQIVLRTILVTLCALIFIHKGIGSQPSFMYNLFRNLAYLNKPLYDQIVGPLPSEYAAKEPYELALELFNCFQSAYNDFFIFNFFAKDTSQIFVVVKGSATELKEKFGELFQQLLPTLTHIPMVVVPKYWKAQPTTLIKNYTGGLLLNGEKFFIPLCSGNDQEHMVLLAPESGIVDFVNNQQSVAYTINFAYLDFLKTTSLWVTKEAYDRAERYVETIRNRLDDRGSTAEVAFSAEQQKLGPNEFNMHEFSQAQKLIGQYQQQQMIDDVITRLRDDLSKGLGSHYHRRFLIYFAHFVDFRGRIYPAHGVSYILPQFRYALQDCIARPFLLSKFKECAAKYYLGSKNKFTVPELIDYFNTRLDRSMRQFETTKVYCDADEPEAFLGCCLEYRRYLNFMAEYRGESDFDAALAYRSRWLASEDESSSGVHHRSLFFGEGEHAVSLNMAGGGIDFQPHDYYLDMFRLYRSEYLQDSGEWENWHRFGFDGLDLYLPHLQIKSRMSRDVPSINSCQIEFFRPLFKQLFMAGGYNMTISRYYEVTMNHFDGWNLFRGTENFEARRFIYRTTWNFFLIRSGNTLMRTFTDGLLKVFQKQSLAFSYLSPLQTLVTVGTIQTRSFVIQRDLLANPTLSLPVPSTKALKQVRKTRRRRYMTVRCLKPDRPLDFEAIGRSLSPNIIHTMDGFVVAVNTVRMKKDCPYVTHFAVHDCFFVGSLYMDSTTTRLRQIVYELYFGKLIPFREQFVRGVRFCLERELRAKGYSPTKIIQVLEEYDQTMKDCLAKLDTMVASPYNPQLLLDSRYYHY